jgi:hypothetical protein
MEPETLRTRVARTTRLTLTALFLAAAMIGCRSTLPDISPEPSRLEQVVAAMSREEWEEADRLLTPILPPLPDREVVDGDRSVALRGR